MVGRVVTAHVGHIMVQGQYITGAGCDNSNELTETNYRYYR